VAIAIALVHRHREKAGLCMSVQARSCRTLSGAVTACAMLPSAGMARQEARFSECQRIPFHHRFQAG
jgi:hypothetical protein